MATIAACLIVKDGAATLERCMGSIRPHVDEVVVYDTGSRDGTLELLDRLQDAEAAPIRVARGEWRDNFAWARERSFELAVAEWLMWIDADDVLVGGGELRPLAADAPPELDGFVASYEAERDSSGTVTQHVWRVRIVRKASGFRWEGIVHEGLFLPTGRAPRLQVVSAERLRVVHEPVEGRLDTARNLEILLAAESRDALDGRMLFDLGLELVGHGRFEEAVPRLRAYLGRVEEWSDERTQAACLLAASLRMTSRPDEALEVELEAAERRPDWTDAALGLAESYAALGRWADAQNWAGRAAELDVPRSPVLLDPRWLRLAPLLRLAEASLVLGARDRAFAALEEAHRRFGEDEWLLDKLDGIGDDPARALEVARQALGRYDPRMRAAVRALWRETGAG